ncbi:hypothetical protein KJ925_04000 [Patescibacteria group bacterium]|nr:hypothetical protein [Patescibacteria group bacterium]
MKNVFGLLIVLSLLALVFYSAYRGALMAWDWTVEEKPHVQAANAIEGTLDKAIEATNDTGWVSRALEPKKK